MRLWNRLKGKAWTKWVGYPLFFNLAFTAGIYLTFPYDPLRDRIEAAARDGTGMEVEIEKVRLAGLTGLRLEGVELLPERLAQAAATAAAMEATGAAEEGQEAPRPEPPPRIRLDEVTAKAEVLSLLRGRKAVRFAVEAFGGEARGRLELGDEERAFRARMRDLDLAASPLRALAGLDVAGRVAEVRIDLRSAGKDFSKADGSIEIRGEGLLVNGGTVQMFDLPQIALGTLDARIVVDGGLATFERFQVEGPDVQAEIEGSVRLQPVLTASSLSGKLRVKPSDDWWNRNQMLKTAADLALPANKDGWRNIGLFGPLSRPSFRPQR